MTVYVEKVGHYLQFWSISEFRLILTEFPACFNISESSSQDTRSDHWFMP